MSVWTRVQSQGLKDVKMKEFVKALDELELKLDDRKIIKNYYGEDIVDNGLKYRGREIDLGIKKEPNGYLSLVGDTYNSGIVSDNCAEELLNLINQRYQKVILEKKLKREGWNVKTTIDNKKIKLVCVS